MLQHKERESTAAQTDRFVALFQYASMGILVANKSGEIVLANNFLLSLFGYNSEEELIGKKIEMLIPVRFSHHHVADRDGYFKHPARRSMGLGMDLFAVKKDGSEFPVEISLSHYSNAEGDFAFAFVSDISRRKEIENAVLNQKEELAAINEQIEELNNDLEEKVELRTEQLKLTMQQLEASRDELSNALGKEKELSDMKSRFVSMASHEFRTPLSTILSSASLIAKYTEGEEQSKRDKHINRIKSAVNNLTDILNDFLSIGKMEDGKISAKYTRFNIYDLLNNVCQELQSLAKPGQQIIYTASGDAEVVLDPSLLRNIVINLLSNAIKFSPENKTIQLKTEVTANTVVIIIKDAGIGISAEDQAHLFERFFRGANVTNIQGTGLGLHIVSKYIELMMGEISFKSTLEEGTEFTIHFYQQPENLLVDETITTY